MVGIEDNKEKIMNKQLSEKLANIHVRIIGIFYLISGVWEYLHIMEAESLVSHLINIYHVYVAWLGFATVLIGIGILYKINLARRLALILAWWNLFTSPILDIWLYIYTVVIKKIFVSRSICFVIIYTIILITLLSSVRVYIIYMLRIPKAGYLFSKNSR